MKITYEEHRKIHEDAVLKCKSVLSDYKPSEKPPTLFCHECGITETQPSFMQKYCRYCGAKLEVEESESKRYAELAKSFSQGVQAGFTESEE